MRGHFAKAKVEPKQKLVEFRVTADALLEVGAELVAEPLRAGPDRRRHRHHDRQGLRRRHEALELRRPRATPRRLGLAPLARLDRPPPGSGPIFKGKKMAGHLGDERVTTQNLQGRRDRCRARPDPGQGRGPRRRTAATSCVQGRGQARPPQGCAVPGRPAQGCRRSGARGAGCRRPQAEGPEP